MILKLQVWLKKTKGRVRLGPATLYTILGHFEEEQILMVTRIEGRKSTSTASPTKEFKCTTMSMSGWRSALQMPLFGRRNQNEILL